MRKIERQLPENEVLEILKNNEYGILSLVTADGVPYGVPMSYAYNDNKLYFHHTNESPSLLNDCIKNCNKACFTVVGNTELLPQKFSTIYESVIAFGEIKMCENPVDGLMQLVKALSPEYAEAGLKYARADAHKVNVFYLEISSVTGKARKKKPKTN